MNDWGFGGWGWGWGMGFGPLLMLLFWVLVIVGVVALFRSLQSGPQSGSRPRAKTAAEIVQERYARGEINREEFEQKMRDLEGPR